MNSKDNDHKVGMPRDPCGTRWKSLFDCVKYHHKYVTYYPEFILNECSIYKGTLCKSLATLQELVQDPSSVMVLKCELVFWLRRQTECLS